MQLLFSPSPAASPKPFSSRTNALTTRSLKVHFKLPVIRKASPTVSVTNTNAARASTALSTSSEAKPSLPVLQEVLSPTANSIAFPSSPIPCPSRKRAHSDDSYDSRDGADEPVHVAAVETPQRTQGNTTPFHRRISHIDILRRRSKSCLAASYFHSDSTLPRAEPVPQAPQPFPTEDVEMPDSLPEPPAKRRPATRRESMIAGNPLGRTVRKARRVVADAQFLASMHSSIALRVRTSIENDGTPTPRSPDEYAAQDALLVERIWHTLVDMGYKPVPLDNVSPPLPLAPPIVVSASPVPTQGAPSPSPPNPTRDAAREAAERAARRTQAVSSAPFNFERVQDIASSPQGGILPGPQLVATLIMRHRERTTRPKRRALGDGPRPQPVSRSPLSKSATSLPPSPTASPSPSFSTFAPSSGR
ncbi:hypothetical protein LXA43DRAFT_899338 [Ganoderma leucocontextum]|nr:hypothetical protein LXA43DRAFT_899338 [Ganoderma leucocontextum]